MASRPSAPRRPGDRQNSADGTQFEATILIEFLDTEGQIQLSARTATGTRILVEQP
jgi:hypothetical protein